MAIRKPLVLISGSLQELPSTDSIVTNGSGNSMVLEIPSGTVNGSNTVFTLSQTPLNNVVIVTLNGLAQTKTTDYTVSGTTVTFTVAPETGTVVYCQYLNALVSPVATSKSSTTLTVDRICTSQRIVVTDANALTTSVISCTVTGKASGGIDELETDPIAVNATCTTNGSINFFISSPFQFWGSYNVTYTIS